jgi:hypothetical protein
MQHSIDLASQAGEPSLGHWGFAAQAREPATGIIAIDIPAVLDRAGAVNNLSGLIEFKK